MLIHEYQAKALFARHGIAVPEGAVTGDPRSVRSIAERVGPATVVKAQVLVGGRGKAGGIALADTPSAAVAHAERILSMTVRGLPVSQVLIERAVRVCDEIYLGLVLDRASQCMSLIASAKGGVDIEEVAQQRPGAIHTFPIDPMIGLRSFHATRAAAAIGLPRNLWRQFGDIAQRLYQVASGADATLCEINPLVVTEDGQLLAVDAKLNVDDNALYRQPELAGTHDAQRLGALEQRADEAGISYVKLDGYIGCMVNGAGLAMATMDVIKVHGGEPANFLDVGGGAQADRVATALRLLLSDPDVRAVLINIFGGITRCDEVARGILAALGEVSPIIPFVVRLAGTNQEEGHRLLRSARLTTESSLWVAARSIVELAGASV